MPYDDKTIAEIPGVARLVEMVFPPGAKDAPHEHPVHSMYFLTDVKLKIAGPPTPTTLGEEGAVAELPAGAAPIFPFNSTSVAQISTVEARPKAVSSPNTTEPVVLGTVGSALTGGDVIGGDADEVLTADAASHRGGVRSPVVGSVYAPKAEASIDQRKSSL